MTGGDNRSLAEIWYEKARDWVDKDAAARLLEDTKSAILAQRMGGCGDIPVNRAEQAVKASPWWHDHVKKCVDARTAANAAKVDMEYTEMKRWEQMNAEANHRAGTRL